MLDWLFKSEVERAIAKQKAEETKQKAGETRAEQRLQSANKAVTSRQTTSAGLITSIGKVLTSEVDVIASLRKISALNSKFQEQVKLAAELDKTIEQQELELVEEVNTFLDEIKPISKKLSKGGVLTPEEEAKLEAYLRKIS